MDSAVRNEDETLKEILTLSEEVSSVYGLLTINFHFNRWDEVEFPYERKTCRQMLQILGENDWHFIIDINELANFCPHEETGDKEKRVN